MILNNALLPPPVGIDIGRSEIRLAQPGRPPVRIARPQNARAGILADDEARRLPGVLRRHRFQGLALALVAPPHAVRACVIETPAIEPGAPRAVIYRDEIARSAGLGSANFESMFWDLPPGDRGISEAFACVLTHDDAEQIIAPLDHAGLRVVALQPELAILARRLRARPAEAVIVADLGRTGARLSILCDGVPLYERRCPELALDALADALAAELALDPEAASLLAQRPIAPPDADSASGTDRLLREHADAAVAAIMESARYIGRRFPACSAGRVLLRGGGGLRDGLAEWIETATGFEARPLSWSDLALPEPAVPDAPPAALAAPATAFASPPDAHRRAAA